MASAIISDTLLFKSPTCTNEDIEIANKLANIAKIDLENYGLDLLKSGTDLSDFTPEELINLDAKETKLAGVVNAKIAQVNTADISDVMKRKSEIEEAMEKDVESLNLDVFVFLITDIINSNSQAIVLGKRSDIVEKSYSVKLENNTALLTGVVSRKKQVIPVMTENV